MAEFFYTLYEYEIVELLPSALLDNTLLNLHNTSYNKQPPPTYIVIVISKIQVVVYYQCCILIG